MDFQVQHQRQHRPAATRRTAPPPKASPARPAPERPVEMPLPRAVWLVILTAMALLLIYPKIDPGRSATADAEAPAAPAFDGAAWLSTSYQSRTEDFLRTESRLGKRLLPIKNQLDYSLFRKLSLADYLVGRKGYLLSQSGIRAYYGRDFLGDTAIATQLRQVRLIQDSLAARGIRLVMLYVPTKEFMMPELIPAEWQGPKNTTNLERYIAWSRELGVDHLDFTPFLQRHMAALQHPLWPKLGSHWSYYAECLAVDTLTRYIERMKGVTMPHFTWSGVESSEKARLRDADAISKIPLLRYPKGLKMGYPKDLSYVFEAGSRPVRTLGIGDSYYRGFEYLETMKYAFGGGEFWYYFNTVSPLVTGGREVWEYDLRSELEKYEVVLVMINAANMANTGSGFIEEAYQMYTRPAEYAARIARERPLRLQAKSIRQDPELLEEAVRRAGNEGLPLDTAIARMSREALL